MKSVIFSLFVKLIQKRWLLMPGKKTHDVLQRGRKAKKIQEYYYIKYATSALRVIAWIILVLGVIGSLVWGITMGGIEGWIILVLGVISALVGGITTGGIEGGLLPLIPVIAVIGIIGSFLAWLLLLAVSELFKLIMDVKENTRSTSESIT